MLCCCAAVLLYRVVVVHGRRCYLRLRDEDAWAAAPLPSDRRTARLLDKPISALRADIERRREEALLRPPTAARVSGTPTDAVRASRVAVSVCTDASLLGGGNTWTCADYGRTLRGRVPNGQ